MLTDLWGNDTSLQHFTAFQRVSGLRENGPRSLGKGKRRDSLKTLAAFQPKTVVLGAYIVARPQLLSMQ